STLHQRKTAPTSNLPLRAGKGWLYEGGIRIPLIIAWKGQLKGSQICDEPVISMDVYPTILDLAGLPLKPRQHRDGLSLRPLLTNNSDHLQRDALYWHFPHYHGSGNRPSGAIRSGDYKLIEWFENHDLELYNLNEDPGEQKNLTASMPEKTIALQKQLSGWRKSVDAAMPRPNPDWKAQADQN
ncbi:hypothetical protein BVY01_04660, partial [bacterium I07]